MNVERFISQRPCLEEIDGFLHGLHLQIESPDQFPHGVQYAEMTSEVLAPLEAYRKRLLTGKEMPSETKLRRAWVYRQGQKPRRK